MSRPKVITLSPTASDPNGISASETLLAARLDFQINGALSTGYDRDGIATSQTPTGADAMTLDGALGLDFHERNGVYVLIYGAANDTGRTFTVVGEDISGNRISEAITGPGAGLIVLGSTKFYHITSVTPDAATAGAIEIGVNGYAEFSTPQHVSITSAADDTGRQFTVYGYDRYGNYVTDTITGANAGASTDQDMNFAWVDRISVDAAPAGATEAGVDGLCESGWYLLNYRGPDFNIGFGCTLSTGASLTYGVQHTFDNILAEGFVETDAVAFNNATVSSETTNQDGNYTNPPRAMRLQVEAYTSGSVTMTVIHTGRS